VEFVLAFADLILDAFDAYVLKVYLLGVVALDLLLKLYQILQLQSALLLEHALPLPHTHSHSHLSHPLFRLFLHPPVESGQLG
jgi:hypothetical protein